MGFVSLFDWLRGFSILQWLLRVCIGAFGKDFYEGPGLQRCGIWSLFLGLGVCGVRLVADSGGFGFRGLGAFNRHHLVMHSESLFGPPSQ